ncbi:unnamed protein product, partial [Oppiella nova]
TSAVARIEYTPGVCLKRLGTGPHVHHHRGVVVQQHLIEYYIFFTTFSDTGSIVPFLRQSSSGSHTSPDMRAVSIMALALKLLSFYGSLESVRPSLLEKGFVSAHEKRFLKPIIDELLGLNHQAPIAPAQLNVDLAQLIRDDCKHPIAANYRQTMKSLNVDLKEFMIYDPQVGGHPEVKLAYTPFVTTNVTIYKHAACTGRVSGLFLNATFPIGVSCNGYHYMQTPFMYIAEINGQQQPVPLANMSLIMSMINGNIMEVTMGTIVDGVCAVNTYIPTDANACSSGTLKSLNVTQMQATITVSN